MSTSAIFSTAPASSKEATTSAIFQAAPTSLTTHTTSAIFVPQEDEGISSITTFGTLNSGVFIEAFAPTATFGTLSSGLYIAPSQASYFGTLSSGQYQTVADRGNTLRGPQFRLNTIALDRFASPLGAVIDTFEDLDLTATGTTTIYTVPAGNSVIITGCLIRIKTADTVTTDADVSVGINPSTTDIFDTETLVGVQSVSDFWNFWQQSSAGLIANSGALIDLDVAVAATATTLTADVYIIGLLL